MAYQLRSTLGAGALEGQLFFTALARFARVLSKMFFCSISFSQIFTEKSKPPALFDPKLTS